jgi:hypothetical protein
MEAWLPTPEQTLSPILGFFVDKHFDHQDPGLHYVILNLITYHGSVHSYRIARPDSSQPFSLLHYSC